MDWILPLLTFAGLTGLLFGAAYWYSRKINESYRRGIETGRRVAYRNVPTEPSADPYGVELGRVRSAESMREAAAYACRMVARDAANKARLANEAASNPQLTMEDRDKAVARQKAWLYTCEAAERCERVVRSLGLQATSSPVVLDDVQDT